MDVILFVGFYDIKEHHLAIAKIFSEYGYNIKTFPLFRYAYDQHDKVDNYAELFAEKVKLLQPTIIFWIFIDVNITFFSDSKDIIKNSINVFYNTDDPINFNIDLIEKCKYFDIVVTNCMENIKEYEKICMCKTIYFPIGVDNELFYPIDNNEGYECDISFFVDNIYHEDYYNNQLVPRRKLIDDIVTFSNKNNKKFFLYGSPILNELFPQNYKGELSYIDQNRMFNKSKVNVCSRPNKNKRSSSYVEMRILASGGLLFLDNIQKMDIFESYHNCILFNSDTFIDELKQILEFYDMYINIKKNATITSSMFSFKNLVEQIYYSVNLIRFDPPFYKKLYNINDECDDLFKHWWDIGRHKGYLHYKKNIPKEFNYEKYMKDNNINDEYVAYSEWIQNGKKDIYIKNKNTNTSFNINNLSATKQQIYETMSIVGKLYWSNNKMKYLQKLKIIYENNPNMNINKIIEIYFNE